MKAIIYNEYGGPEVLKYVEVKTPQPKDDEILVNVYATGSGYGDLIARNLKELPKEMFNMPDILFPMVRPAFYTRQKLLLLCCRWFPAHCSLTLVTIFYFCFRNRNRLVETQCY